MVLNSVDTKVSQWQTCYWDNLRTSQQKGYNTIVLKSGRSDLHPTNERDGCLSMKMQWLVRRGMPTSDKREVSHQENKKKNESTEARKGSPKSVITEARESMDKNDMRRFYSTINGTHNTASVPAMCNGKTKFWQTKKTMVLVDWKINWMVTIQVPKNPCMNRFNISSGNTNTGNVKKALRNWKQQAYWEELVPNRAATAASINLPDSYTLILVGWRIEHHLFGWPNISNLQERAQTRMCQLQWDYPFKAVVQDTVTCPVEQTETS